jgi:hypothetical protein
MYEGKIRPEFIEKALGMYEIYKSDKQNLNDRICENERWYRKWHEANLSGTYNENDNSLTCATAYVFSAIENKYADAIDNFPRPKILEREPQDTQTAELLSKILPVQLDISNFKRCYKRNWRKKLKYGTAVYGIFYNSQKSEIEIKSLNILGIYCDMNLSDVQESQFLFITQAFDNECLKADYPQFAHLFEGDAAVDTYTGRAVVHDRTEVIDCYYKKPDKSVHLMKFVKGTLIEASEDIPGYENGLYEHGKYPVVFDCLYQCDDSPFGYGVVDVIRNPQMYIDRLDGIILKNAALAGKQRWLVKDKGAINEEEFKDWSKDIIHVDGSLDETHIKPFQAQSISDFVLQHRVEKIMELKEVIGNRDFQQGATTGGVTAASAISTLQQSGEKLSRAMIDDSFDAYAELISICVELIREFYSNERIYRITNKLGNVEFVEFSNRCMSRIDYKRDALGFPVSAEYHRAEFDIEIIPERQSPSSRESNNQLVLELWKNGLFTNASPQTAVMVLESMNFDGKERMLERLKKLQNTEEENYGLQYNGAAEEPKQYAQGG